MSHYVTAGRIEGSLPEVVLYQNNFIFSWRILMRSVFIPFNNLGFHVAHEWYTFIKLMHVGHTDTVQSVSMLNTALTEKKEALRGHIGRHSYDQKREEAFFISLAIITRYNYQQWEVTCAYLKIVKPLYHLLFLKTLKPILRNFR